MRTTAYMPEEALLKKAVGLLVDQLGPVEASRFLNLAFRKRTNSVRRHHSWQTQLNKNEFFARVFVS
jgi:hypothetical protein